MIKVFRLSEMSQEDLERIIERNKLRLDEDLRKRVLEIIEFVRKAGDRALLELTKRFDGVELESLEVPREDIEKARELVSDEFLEALELASRNIERFHRAQLRARKCLMEVCKGVYAGFILRPLSRVGIYAPGGRAIYPSTVLMCGIPARIAGVREIILCTPPKRDGGVDPRILVACELAGVDRIFRIGGAQAIAAMALGTESVPKVEKVVGPGNIYVTAAKLILREEVEIDMPAGPSEIMILADDSADPELLAMDMISQAEHDPNAVSILVTPSEDLARKVREHLRELARKTERRGIVEESLGRNGAIILCDDLDSCIEFVNRFAPEHLEVVCSNALSILDRIENAGSIFLGEYSTVPLGDYASGTNHVLPTSGYARLRGGLSVDDFLKKITFQMVTEDGLKELSDIVRILAKEEGLPAHAEAVSLRLRKLSDLGS